MVLRLLSPELVRRRVGAYFLNLQAQLGSATPEWVRGRVGIYFCLPTALGLQLQNGVWHTFAGARLLRTGVREGREPTSVERSLQDSASQPRTGAQRGGEPHWWSTPLWDSRSCGAWRRKLAALSLNPARGSRVRRIKGRGQRSPGSRWRGLAPSLSGPGPLSQSGPNQSHPSTPVRSNPVPAPAQLHTPAHNPAHSPPTAQLTAHPVQSQSRPDQSPAPPQPKFRTVYSPAHSPTHSPAHSPARSHSRCRDSAPPASPKLPARIETKRARYLIGI